MRVDSARSRLTIRGGTPIHVEENGKIRALKP